MTAGLSSCVSHLESALDGTRFPAESHRGLYQGRPVWVRYDLDAVRALVTPARFRERPAGLWRYRELLPLRLDREPVTLGETATPLVSAPLVASALGIDDVWIKDEGRLPTGSFKDRGMAVAVNMAVDAGKQRFVVPTNGNAGGALAAYAARAGAEATILMPHDTPPPNIAECVRYGARTYLVDGLIDDCGRLARELADGLGLHDLSTLKEPYRLEGKKTMGLELAEDLDWVLPAVIVYPTGGGTGLVGMWKAFAELRALGWLRAQALPRMVVVQSDGCAPIVRAFAAGERFATRWTGAHTVAAGIRVPAAVGDFMILDAVRESGGMAIAAAEAEIEAWQARGARLSGLALCPEAGACLAALAQLVATGWVTRSERVVVFNTASAHKYATGRIEGLPRLDPSRPALAQIKDAR